MSNAASMLRISVIDAANNCVRENAVATVTLRSGVQFTGELEKPTQAESTTVHMKTGREGWSTIDFEEIVAVGVERRDSRGVGW